MRYAKIGGQAVIEGVMMRYKDDYAVAVRKPDHTIEVKKDKYESLVSRLHLNNIPIIRGMFAFIDSLIIGISTLMFSSSFYDEEEEAEGAGDEAKEEKEKKTASGTEGPVAEAVDKIDLDAQEKEIDRLDEAAADEKKEMSDALLMGLTLVISIVIAVFLFMLTPYFISNLFGRFTKSNAVLAAIEGVIRVAIFLIYMVAISKMKDIQRVFMYHGAEHKTISCIEHGMELTPENALKCSRLHKRCGTNFLFIVIIVSIIVFMFITTKNRVMRVLLRLILVPVIAGISYEIIQFAGRHDNKFTDIISAPGLALQKYLTTKEPDLEMLEVAIASVEAIYDWRAFQENKID